MTKREILLYDDILLWVLINASGVSLKHIEPLKILNAVIIYKIARKGNLSNIIKDYSFELILDLVNKL